MLIESRMQEDPSLADETRVDRWTRRFKIAALQAHRLYGWLAYTLSRRSQGKRTDYTRAFFGWAKFEIAPEALHKVKETLDLDETHPEIHVLSHNERASLFYDLRKARLQGKERRRRPDLSKAHVRRRDLPCSGL